MSTLEAGLRQLDLGRKDVPECAADSGLAIDREGHWFYLGSPILRPALVRLFAGVLRREGEQYFLQTPVEKLRIAVADAPFVVTSCEWREAGSANQILWLSTNLDDSFPLDAAHPLQFRGKEQQRRPYVRVRDELEAVLSRSVYYELCEEILRVPHHEQRQGLWSAGMFHEFA